MLKIFPFGKKTKVSFNYPIKAKVFEIPDELVTTMHPFRWFIHIDCTKLTNYYKWWKITDSIAEPTCEIVQCCTFEHCVIEINKIKERVKKDDSIHNI